MYFWLENRMRYWSRRLTLFSRTVISDVQSRGGVSVGFGLDRTAARCHLRAGSPSAVSARWFWSSAGSCGGGCRVERAEVDAACGLVARWWWECGRFYRGNCCLIIHRWRIRDVSTVCDVLSRGGWVHQHY